MNVHLYIKESQSLTLLVSNVVNPLVPELIVIFHDFPCVPVSGTLGTNGLSALYSNTTFSSQ